MNSFEQEKAVYNILMTNPVARDSDTELYYQVLRLSGFDPQRTVTEWLGAVRDGYIPPMDSIMRARREVQEQIPATRGRRYAERELRAQRRRMDEARGDLHKALDSIAAQEAGART